MKPAPRLSTLLAAAALVAPLTALAHPGHEGDHDFTWELSHLAAHPIATFLCLAVLAAASWAIWRATRSPHRRAAKNPRTK